MPKDIIKHALEFKEENKNLSGPFVSFTSTTQLSPKEYLFHSFSIIVFIPFIIGYIKVVVGWNWWKS